MKIDIFERYMKIVAETNEGYNKVVEILSDKMKFSEGRIEGDFITYEDDLSIELYTSPSTRYQALFYITSEYTCIVQ